MSGSARPARTPRRKEYFKTVNGVRFSVVRWRQPGEKTISPGEAMNKMLGLIRKA